MKRLYTILLAALAILMLASCSPTSITGPASLSGRYILTRIGGHTLPVAAPYGFAYQAGSLELHADGTYIDVIQISGVVDSLFGTYVASSDSVRFTPNGYVPYAAFWDTRGALLVRWNDVYTYTKGS